MLLITTPSVGRVKYKSKCKYKYIHASTNENTQTISNRVSYPQYYYQLLFLCISVCVNRSGPVSILEELMKVFRISIFHIWNNQLIFFLFNFFFFHIFFIFLSPGGAAADIEQLGLVDGGGRAVQGLPAQGPARADGEVRQGREEGTSQSEGTKLYSLIIPYIF